MNELDELIAVTAAACCAMDKIIENEKKFCQDCSIELERMSWNYLCMMNDLKSVREGYYVKL